MIGKSQQGGEAHVEWLGEPAELYFARPKVTHLNVAMFRQNVGLLSVPPALWRGAATSQFGPREV